MPFRAQTEMRRGGWSSLTRVTHNFLFFRGGGVLLVAHASKLKNKLTVPCANFSWWCFILYYSLLFPVLSHCPRPNFSWWRWWWRVIRCFRCVHALKKEVSRCEKCRIRAKKKSFVPQKKAHYLASGFAVVAGGRVGNSFRITPLSEAKNLVVV